MLAFSQNYFHRGHLVSRAWSEIQNASEKIPKRWAMASSDMIIPQHAALSYANTCINNCNPPGCSSNFPRANAIPDNSGDYLPRRIAEARDIARSNAVFYKFNRICR